VNDPATVSPFDALLGVEVLSDDPEEARARFEVRDDLKQPYGYLHGGVIPAAFDGLCSRATMLQVVRDGNVALAQSLDISLIRSVASGTVTLTARARHRGRSSWIWDAEATDEQDRLCVLARVTIAIRPSAEPGTSDSTAEAVGDR
jgi:1,4-dihydroxy-2-naphthoyl-CoA hydrolase